jgi:hypothetical protein
MVFSMFLLFQVFIGVLVLACEHPKEKNNNKWWLVIKTFQKKKNVLFIYNNQK